MRHGHHHCTRAGAALILACAGTLFGCATNRGPAEAPTPVDATGGRAEWTGGLGRDGEERPPWPVVHAAWRDIEAAVHRAASQNSLAVIEVEARAVLTREFRLIGLRGERGSVRFTAARLVENSIPADPWITFEITLGAIGSAEQERDLRSALLEFRPAYAR